MRGKKKRERREVGDRMKKKRGRRERREIDMGWGISAEGR